MGAAVVVAVVVGCAKGAGERVVGTDETKDGLKEGNIPGVWPRPVTGAGTGAAGSGVGPAAEEEEEEEEEGGGIPGPALGAGLFV